MGIKDIYYNKKNSTEEKISRVVENIKKVYLMDNRPWIVGYSGGKDSTTVVHLIFKALETIPVDKLSKKIYIISSDTMVETPLVKNLIDSNLSNIFLTAQKRHLPIETFKVKPEIEQTFWVNIIGRGYPTPNQTFRWCTDRMKIDPADKFIENIVDKSGEVIMLLGVRKGESNSRDKVIENHSIEESLLMRHTSLPNAFVFSPILEFNIDDIWTLLLNEKEQCPWGNDYSILYSLYNDSSSTECPLVVDKNIKESAGSCGNSRFGCWVCTVVSEDKALSGFIRTGTTWLSELLEYRNWLTEIRDDRTKRLKARTNGQYYFMNVPFKNEKIVIPKKSKRDKVEIGLDGIDNLGNKWEIFNKKSEAIEYIKNSSLKLNSSEDPRVIVKDYEGYSILGLGPFTFETRAEILLKLLQTQQNIFEKYNIEVELISKEEILEIAKLWIESGERIEPIVDAYETTLNKPFDYIFEEVSMLDNESLNLLERTCIENGVNFNEFLKLIELENENINLLQRKSITKQISNILNQDITNI
jgi:DNA sulfur modification protein DndC